MKIVSGVILALIVAVGAFLFTKSAEDRVTADIVARADRFAIPADWNVQNDIVRGERFLCRSSNPCPSIARRWNTGTELTIEDLQALSQPAGFPIKTEGTCERDPGSVGDATLCRSSGSDGEYEYQLVVSSTSAGEPHNVVLVVEPTP